MFQVNLFFSLRAGGSDVSSQVKYVNISVYIWFSLLC